MLEGLKKRFLRLFMSKDKLLKRERKREKTILQSTYEKKLKEFTDKYLKDHNLKSKSTIPAIARKEMIQRATVAADEKIAKRRARKAAAIRINLEPHGILYNVTYAAGVLETNRVNLSASEQDKYEMGRVLSIAKSPRGNIEYLNFHAHFFGDVEAMAFYRTYFDPNTKLGKEIWNTLKIDLNDPTPVEQQKRLLLEKNFWPAAKAATGYKALFSLGSRSRINIFRKLQEWFNYQEESLNSKMRLGLDLYDRPNRARIFSHFFKRLGLNFFRVMVLSLFLPLIDTGRYIRKNPYLFLIFTIFAILCFTVPPLTAVPAFIAAGIGLTYLSGSIYTAAFIITGVYATLLWNILSIKIVNTFINFLSDMKIIVNDKDFWLWQAGRSARDGIRYLFGRREGLDAMVNELTTGMSPLQMASVAMQQEEQARKSSAVAMNGVPQPLVFKKQEIVLQEKKYVLEFMEGSVKVHAPNILKMKFKEISFHNENLDRLRYLFNFMNENRQHFADDAKKYLVLLARILRHKIKEANLLQTLHQEIQKPLIESGIPLFPQEFYETIEDNAAGVGTPLEVPVTLPSVKPLSNVQLLHKVLEDFMFNVDNEEEDDDSKYMSLTTLNQMAELAKEITKKAEVVKKDTLNMSLEGLSYQQISGDGHCLFTAVGLYLNQNVNDLRNNVANYLSEHKDNFEPYYIQTEINFEQHIDAIRNGGEWADHIEIEALQQLTGRPIIIIRPDANPIIPDNIVQYNQPPIFVYFNGEDHYDALIIENDHDAHAILSKIQAQIAQGNSVTYSPPHVQLDKQSVEYKKNADDDIESEESDDASSDASDDTDDDEEDDDSADDHIDLSISVGSINATNINSSSQNEKANATTIEFQDLSKSNSLANTGNPVINSSQGRRGSLLNVLSSPSRRGRFTDAKNLAQGIGRNSNDAIGRGRQATLSRADVQGIRELFKPK